MVENALPSIKGMVTCQENPLKSLVLLEFYRLTNPFNDGMV